MTFKLILSAVQQDLFEAFKKHFAQFPEVEVVFKPFEQVEFDCVVSAANSFGLMDGGVDQAITDYFGLQMMHRVQKQIIDDYHGEQPVGTSMIVRGNAEYEWESNTHLPLEKKTLKKNKYVAHTPTMRVPMNINQTTNVYSAMKAMLIAVEKHNKEIDRLKEYAPQDTKIDIVVCPGLGTNTGRVPADLAARQMATAYYHFNNRPAEISWYYASARHNEIVRAEFNKNEDGLDLSQFENLK